METHRARDLGAPAPAPAESRQSRARGDEWRRDETSRGEGRGEMASKISHIPAVVSSPALVAALLSFSIAQIAKVFTHYHATGKVDYTRIVGSGGMPSSHTALVVGLCTSIGLKEGMQSSIFALCLVFSLVVMYDATGVRLHAGRQAEVLNQLIVELPRDHPLTDSRPLRDTLGHTPIQVVVGAILGMSVAYVHFVFWMATYSL